MLQLILLLLQISMIFCDLKAAIVWGLPKNAENCQNSSVGLKECYQMCMEDDGCVLAFWKNESCSICGPDTVTSVEKPLTDSSNGCDVIFKYNDTSDQCPASFNYPEDIGGSVIDNNTLLEYYYEILGNETEWQIIYTELEPTSTTSQTTTNSLQCDEGWKYFPRLNCGWCIKVFEQIDSNYMDCVDTCKSYDAILTGLENLNETYFIADTGLTFGANTTQQDIFVDGTRKPECNTNETRTNCNITFPGSFNFNDTCAASQNGYVSLKPGVIPDGLDYNGVMESYLIVYSAPNSFYGKADDVTYFRNPVIIGCACGKYSKVQSTTVGTSRETAPTSRATVSTAQKSVATSQASVPTTHRSVSTSQEPSPTSRATLQTSQKTVPTSQATVPISQSNIPTTVPTSKSTNGCGRGWHHFGCN